MRVEWAQCMACADCWEEEVTLLQEEMRQVVDFLEWRSRDWLSKVDARTGTVTSAVCAGLSAYAREQGSVFHSLAVQFCQCWHSTLLSLSVIALFFTLIFQPFSQPCHSYTRSPLSPFPCYPCFPPCFHAIDLLFD